MIMLGVFFSTTLKHFLHMLLLIPLSTAEPALASSWCRHKKTKHKCTSYLVHETWAIWVLYSFTCKIFSVLEKTGISPTVQNHLENRQNGKENREQARWGELKGGSAFWSLPLSLLLVATKRIIFWNSLSFLVSYSWAVVHALTPGLFLAQSAQSLPARVIQRGPWQPVQQPNTNRSTSYFDKKT